MELNVLYEDNHVIVCFKPRGILSQGADKNIENMVDIVKSYLIKTYQKPGDAYLGLLHRLDLNVAGVMVFAKTSKAAKRLSEQIRQHQFQKQYLAIVHGRFDVQKGLYQDYLEKDPQTRQAQLSDSRKGKLAELEFEVLDYHNTKDLSLLKIDLKTGRFHQIRYQMSYHRHPLLGDQKYGNDKHVNDFFLGLFAFHIGFKHPTTNVDMQFQVKPKDSHFRDFEALERMDWRAL